MELFHSDGNLVGIMPDGGWSRHVSWYANLARYVPAFFLSRDTKKFIAMSKIILIWLCFYIAVVVFQL